MSRYVAASHLGSASRAVCPIVLLACSAHYVIILLHPSPPLTPLVNQTLSFLILGLILYLLSCSPLQFISATTVYLERGIVHRTELTSVGRMARVYFRAASVLTWRRLWASERCKVQILAPRMSTSWKETEFWVTPAMIVTVGTSVMPVVESSWNVMAHGDVGRGSELRG